MVLTGGEPMLQPDLVSLSHALGKAGRFVTIETAGTLLRPVHADLMSISPKRANSTPHDLIWTTRHEELRERPEVVARMTREYRYQLKYVIDTPDDVDDVDRHVQSLGGIAPSRVFLMPQGTQADEIRAKTSWLSLAASKARILRVAPAAHRTLRKSARHVKRLIEADQIQAKVAQLGRQITEDYRDRPLTVVGVLTGSLVLVSDLIRSIDLPLRVGMIQASSYRGKTTVADNLGSTSRNCPMSAGVTFSSSMTFSTPAIRSLRS